MLVEVNCTCENAPELDHHDGGETEFHTVQLPGGALYLNHGHIEFFDAVLGRVYRTICQDIKDRIAVSVKMVAHTDCQENKGSDQLEELKEEIRNAEKSFASQFPDDVWFDFRSSFVYVTDADDPYIHVHR